MKTKWIALGSAFLFILLVLLFCRKPETSRMVIKYQENIKQDTLYKGERAVYHQWLTTKYPEVLEEKWIKRIDISAEQSNEHRYSIYISQDSSLIYATKSYHISLPVDNRNSLTSVEKSVLSILETDQGLLEHCTEVSFSVCIKKHISRDLSRAVKSVYDFQDVVLFYPHNTKVFLEIENNSIISKGRTQQIDDRTEQTSMYRNGEYVLVSQKITHE